VALALLDVPAAEEEHLAAHLVGCADCREAYAAVADSVQQALAATPAIAPPAGFSGRVLGAMGMADERAIRPAPPRRTGWRVPLLVAAAVLVGLLAGVGGTLATVPLLPSPGAPDRQPAAAALVTGAGQPVGSVGVASLGGRAYVSVSITAGRPDQTYECVLVAADGSRSSGGTWTLTSEYGDLATGTWLVPLPAGPPARVELVTPSGKVWSAAEF
jgi:hypothetical protein